MFPSSKAARSLSGRARALLPAILGLASLAASAPAFAGNDRHEPGVEALEAFRGTEGKTKAVENRFFLKQERFEIAPVIGYVPNNPFAVRYVGGAVLGFHFSELISAQAQIGYSPDLGKDDLKGLVAVLLDRAANAASDADFQQPLDKVTLSAAFGVAWSPLYGKINLVGETVLYGFAGAAMLSKSNFIAKYVDSPSAIEAGDIVDLGADPGQPTEVKIAPVLGIGQNYFLNQMMAFKIDARAAFYVDNKPQYDPEIPITEKRLYNNFIVSGGVAFFIPRMKPRLYDF